ncbi:MAG: efflux RND transporter periplasmic adaptor subunit [Gammaproteobacteria bacterium]|nr:efflux RND transporter periplasmic adaptor subunit [Gammaproteobacteria bacterium]
MNKQIIAGLIVITAGLVWGLFSMFPAEDTSSTMQKKETAVEHAGKHADPNYVCPMHPQIIRGEAGSCPICGMDLIEVEQDKPAAKKERKILYWVAPMDANYRRDGPGKSPMGMDLVPFYEPDESGPVVTISAAMVNNMGVRSAVVEKGKLWRKIDTVGYIDFDETRLSHVHLRTDGWIQKLLTQSEGERVKKGEKLFEFYSPSIVNAMEEYVQALNSRTKSLIRASNDRLISLGVNAKEIKTLQKTLRVPQVVSVYAAQDGVVSQLKVREGMYVKPGTVVMSLADLSSVWLLAEVFERQAGWVKVGQYADVTLGFIPGKTWQGKVEYVYPQLDSKTRTLKARLRFDNPGELLKPNMFAKVAIYGGAKKDMVIIPSEALIRTGKEQRVIIDLGEGRFVPRDVVAGMESGGYVEIKEGLRADEKIVLSGHFLIDSEASLKASLMRMTDTEAEIEMAPSATVSDEMKAKDAAMIMGQGVIKSVSADQHKLNMAHEPIPAINWPAMTMDFQFKHGVDVSGLKQGDAVQFHLEKTTDGYVISSITKK